MNVLPLALFLLLLVDISLARPFGVATSSQHKPPMPGIRAFASPRATSPTARILPPLRGGATTIDDEVDAHMPPRISAQDMALALRWTGEVNRRLRWGTEPSRLEASTHLVAPIYDEATHAMRGGESSEAASSLPLTLFHAKSPRRQGGRGAGRWGPELKRYVERICRQLDLSNEGAVELSLALMYLDRASSPETPRSNGAIPVPFLQPRTVHRVVLTALLLAAHTTHGVPLPVLMERVEDFGVPPDQLAQMIQWMHLALGDPGYFVATDSIQRWQTVLAETSRLRDLVMDEEKGLMDPPAVPVAPPPAPASRETATITTAPTPQDASVDEEESEDAEESAALGSCLEAL